MNPVATPSFTQRSLALLLLVALIGSGYLLTTQVWLAQYRHYESNTERLLSRLHNLQRLTAARPQLEGAIQNVRNDATSAAYFLPPATPALAAAALQQRVKSLIEESGGTLLSTQTLPVSEEGGAVRVAVSVTLQGNVEMLQKTLHGLESQKPLLFIDNLEINARQYRARLPTGQIAPVTTVQLNGQFEVAGYLRKEGE